MRWSLLLVLAGSLALGIGAAQPDRWGAAGSRPLADAAGAPPVAPRSAASNRVDSEAPDGDWVGSARRAIAAREYRASRTARGLQAPNRRHRLRTYFDPMGVRVFDRRSQAEPLLALSLERVGRASALSTAAPGVVTHAGHRVELARGNEVVEWYENSADGLEQGFTLGERPPGSGPLLLEVATAHATVDVAAGAIAFRAGTGRSLRFSGLRSWDAEGVALASHFEAAPRGYRIVVDDSGARYPIVIDPLLTGEFDAVFQADQIVANFGISVAFAGDVNADGYADVIIGASQYDNGQNDEGAAFIFHGGPGGVGDGDPTNADTILEADQAGAFLGERGVASAGDVNGDGYDDVIVGAYLYDVTPFGDEGAAWVFHGGPSGIPDGSPATADAVLEGDQQTGFFGWDVAGAGDVDGDGFADVIVGAFLYSAGQSSEGAAFVFHGGASGVADGGPPTADAQLESDQANAQLGWAVSSAGDVDADGYADVIVGAVLYDGSIGDSGGFFVFHGSALGIGSRNVAGADFAVTTFNSGDRAGEAVTSLGDFDGDGYGDVAVGAPNFDDGSLGNAGAAFLYYGSAAGLVGRSGFTVTAGNVLAAKFGSSLGGPADLNGDGYGDLISGSPEYTGLVTADNGEGAVHVYFGRPGGLPDSAVRDAIVESNQALANLGRSVAAAGDVDGDGLDDIVAGAPFFTDGELSEGHAFVYHGNDVGIDSADIGFADTWIESNQGSATLGRSVASAGDVNGDGYGDVIVGAPFFDAGGTQEGAAFVFLGDAAGIADGRPATADAQLESDQDFAWFGNSVASAGDVNGDGYGDVIVGAPRFDAGEQDEGAAFVFLGSASGIADGDPGTAHARLEADQDSADFGLAVASAGDVNGDGYADVIVGARFYDADESGEGAAFVFLGSASGLPDGDPTTAHAQFESNSIGGQLGRSVASAGDVNGDGYGDVIVGAPTLDDVASDEGAAFIFLGGPSGMTDGDPTTADTRLDSKQPDAELGVSVASAGDVNGDGYGDVIVGAPLFAAGEPNEGAAFVFLGGPSGIADGDPGTAHAQIEADQMSAALGNSVASAGDLNGDGYGDLVVGASAYDAEGLNDGAAFIHLGSASGVVAAGPGSSALIWAVQDLANLGISVASAGDVNGDGLGDVILGADQYDAPTSGEGIALIQLGSAPARTVHLRQLRGDGSGVPVQPGGLSHRDDGFEVTMEITSPRGRERAKLEVEACPVGSPFGDVACGVQRTADWVDLGSSGAVFGTTVTGLTRDTAYRWRARPLYTALSATQPGVVPAERPGTWRRIAGGGGAAPDIRIVPEPGAGVSLLVGCAATAALARRRAVRSPPGAGGSGQVPGM